MSVYGTNQVEELMIGNAEATESTVSTFIDTADNKELAVLSKDGTALAAGKKFYILQKTLGESSKGLNYEFSDEVEPDMIDEIKAVKYAPEKFKSIKVNGFSANLTGNALYSVKIRLMNDGGSLSPENFRHIVGSYLTPSSGVNASDIIDGIKKTLEASLLKEGGGMFEITSDSSSLTITALEQRVVPGKIIGTALHFDVEVAVRENDMNSENLGILSTEVLEPGTPGNGTGKYAVNLEWFTKGFKYDADREAGYPVNFNVPYYADVNSKYNTIHIKYKKQRKYTSVENQHKVLTILVDAGVNGADYTATNSILAKLDTVSGKTTTPLA